MTLSAITTKDSFETWRVKINAAVSAINAPGGSAGIGSFRLPNIGAFKTVDLSGVNQVYLEGYDSASDGGEGLFYRASSSTFKEDLGYVVLDGTGTRWLRQIGDDMLKVEHFGVFSVKKRAILVSPQTMLTNATRLQNALTGLVSRGGGSLFIGNGYYHLDGNLLISDADNQSDNIADNYDSISICIRGNGTRSFLIQNNPTKTLLRIYGYSTRVSLKDFSFSGRGSTTTADLVEVQSTVYFETENINWMCHGGYGLVTHSVERARHTSPKFFVCRSAYMFSGANETYVYDEQLIGIGFTQDIISAGTNRRSYSVNASVDGSGLKSSGTSIQDLRTSATVVNVANMRLIGGSVKTTQHSSGHLFRNGENIGVDNHYYEGFGVGTNAAIITPGSSAKATLTSAITDADIYVPVDDLYYFPGRVSAAAAAILDRNYLQTVVIYHPSNLAIFEYAVILNFDWESKRVRLDQRNVAGSTATQAQRNWPAGSIIRERMRDWGSRCTVTINNCHLESFQGALTGTTFDYNASLGHTAGEVVVGFVPDEFNNLQLGGIGASSTVILKDCVFRDYSIKGGGKVQHMIGGYSKWPGSNAKVAEYQTVGPFLADGSESTDPSLFGSWGIEYDAGSSAMPLAKASKLLTDINDWYTFGVPMFSGSGGVGFVDNQLESYTITTVSGTNTGTVVSMAAYGGFSRNLSSSQHIGSKIDHPGLPAGTTITGASGSSVTFSANATSSMTAMANIQTRWFGKYSWDGAVASLGLIHDTTAAGGFRSVARLVGLGAGATSYGALNIRNPNTQSDQDVVSYRRTGWTADTGVSYRGGSATYSATASASYDQTQTQALMDSVKTLSQTVKALKDDLIAHGLIGA